MDNIYEEARLIGRNCFLKHMEIGYMVGLKDIEHLFDGQNDKEIIGNFQEGYLKERNKERD